MKVIDMTDTMTLLPPPADNCQECAEEHEPEIPHNCQSLYYQMKFKAEHGRYPTWNDAMAHCTKEMKADWIGHFAAMVTKYGNQPNGQVAQKALEQLRSDPENGVIVEEVLDNGTV